LSTRTTTHRQAETVHAHKVINSASH